MGTAENESAWSTTAATNANSDSSINWAEGQDAASVNNSARSMMAARRKAQLDMGGILTAGGTANALTVVTNQVLSAPHLAGGQRLTVRSSFANTSTTVTLAVDGLTALPIKRANGTALGIGDIVADQFLDLVYTTGSAEWRCINIPAQGAAKAAFHVTKGGTDQAIATTAATLITWNTAVVDVGSHFSSNAWTPPGGMVMLALSATFLNVAVGSTMVLSITKDGSFLNTYSAISQTTGANTVNLAIIDLANGANAYAAYAQTSDSSYVIDGLIADTRFTGSAL